MQSCESEVKHTTLLIEGFKVTSFLILFVFTLSKQHKCVVCLLGFMSIYQNTQWQSRTNFCCQETHLTRNCGFSIMIQAVIPQCLQMYFKCLSFNRCGSVGAAWRFIPALMWATFFLKRPHTHGQTSSRILFGLQRFGWTHINSTSTTGTLQPER